MAIEKSCNQIGLIAVDIVRFPAPHKVSQQRLSDLGIRFRSQRLAQHRWGNGHVQQMQPAIHVGKDAGEVSLGMSKRVFVETARNRDVSAEGIPHELLIEALDCREDG